MRDVEHAGPYKGAVISHSFGRTRKSGCCQLVVDCQLDERWVVREWIALPEALRIRGWVILTKKNGDKNESQIKALSEAFGWDGDSLEELDRLITPAVEVVFNIEEEEDGRGGFQPRLTWINNRGWIPAGSETDLAALDAIYRGKSRRVEPREEPAPPIDDVPPDGLPPDGEIPF